jgi:outer membrane protein insertion porin family
MHKNSPTIKGFYKLKARKSSFWSRKIHFSWCSYCGDISFNSQTVVILWFAKRTRNNSAGEEISAAIKLGKLGLFDEISFYVNKVQNDSIYLDLNIVELPKLNQVKFVGLKTKTEALIKTTVLIKVVVKLDYNHKKLYRKQIQERRYYNTKVNINTVKDTSTVNSVNMLVSIDKGEK